MTAHLKRREALRLLGGITGLGILTACSSSAPEAKPTAPAAASQPTPAAANAAGSTPGAQAAPAQGGKVVEINHWHTLTASDADVWGQALDNFNNANASQNVKITYQVIPDDQFGTKLLAASTTGEAPDFSWAEGYGRRDWVNKGVVLPIDDLVKQAGLDLTDFTDQGIKGAMYDGKLYGVPMDSLSFQMLVNNDHAKAAGLEETKPPADGDQLLDWARKMTQKSGDTVTRSGFLMTGSGLHINLVWSVVAHQMGFRQFSDDLKTAAINPDAGKAAAQWVLDLFDKYQVATRDVADRYKAFGTGEGSIFWTGPWTLNGYVQQGLNFRSAVMPQVGKDNSTRGELWNLEMYVQKDKSRYENAIKAIKWLSDNTFFWSSKGRGPTVRKSILSRPDYATAVYDDAVGGAFMKGGSNATFYRPPIVATNDFNPYSSLGFIAKTMDPVWAKQASIDDAMKTLADGWQKALDAG
jgi:multiple sugar transport system substrate-binding protein